HRGFRLRLTLLTARQELRWNYGTDPIREREREMADLSESWRTAGRTSHSAVTYGLALATTCLFALVLERGSHGNWLEPYFRSWLGAAVVGAFLVTMLFVMRRHRNSLLSKSMP